MYEDLSNLILFVEIEKYMFYCELENAKNGGHLF